MVNVNYIFTRVNDSLTRKNQAGYASVADFNGDLRDTENILFEFYYKDFEINQKISDAISVFIEEPPAGFAIVNGYVAYPPDYRHPIEMVYRLVRSSKECKDPDVKEILM